MTDLYIDVQVYGGTPIPSAIEQMVALADRLQISVWASLNGIRTLARPGDDATLILKAWEGATSAHPYATAQPDAATKADAP